MYIYIYIYIVQVKSEFKCLLNKSEFDEILLPHNNQIFMKYKLCLINSTKCFPCEHTRWSYVHR